MKIQAAVFLGLTILTVACTRSETPKMEQDSHFFVSFAPVGWHSNSTALDHNFGTNLNDRELCERALRASVCETTYSAQEIAQGWSSVPCSSASASYVPALMAFYDEMPARLRPSLCTLERIFISDGITSTAFASPIMKSLDEAPVGAYIGARKSTFLNQPTVSALVTWKEQLPFGGSAEFLANDPSLVQINYGLNTGLPADGLYYVLIHEIGHLLDFANFVSATSCGPNRSGSNCVPNPGTFASLSWETSSKPLAHAKHLRQGEFCYYNCAGLILSPSEGFTIYSSLMTSAFITPYSGMNSREDFADFFAFNLLWRQRGLNYRIEFPGQGSLDMNRVFEQNPLVRAKLDYVERLWMSPNFKISNR